MPNSDRPDDRLRRLSEDLGLTYEPQDWGIVNADGSRLNEFVSYFKSTALEPTQRFELADLILASANEALNRGMEISLENILTLANGAEPSFAHHIDYWLGLKDEDEFPLSAKLRLALGRSAENSVNSNA
jgi:hypothetical protein